MTSHQLPVRIPRRSCMCVWVRNRHRTARSLRSHTDTSASPQTLPAKSTLYEVSPKNTLVAVSHVSWCSRTLLTVFALEAFRTQTVVGVGQIDACAIVLARIGQAGLLILFIHKNVHKIIWALTWDNSYIKKKKFILNWAETNSFRRNRTFDLNIGV